MSPWSKTERLSALAFGGSGRFRTRRRRPGPTGIWHQRRTIALRERGYAIKLSTTLPPSPGMVRGNATRNILLFQGTAAERATAVETVLAFDVDWMRGQSVGIYPIRNATPNR